MMQSLALLFVLPTFSAGSFQGDCHGPACAAAGSASMLQTQTRDLYEAHSLAAMNSSHSSALFVHTKNNQDLFNKITAKGVELKELIDAFLKSDLMTKICSETPLTGGSKWDCDPSKISGSDLDELLGRLNNTVLGQEALEAWTQIVTLVQKPMTWIKEIIDEWLPKLKQIVADTQTKIKDADVEDFFDAENFGWDDFLKLFEKKDGKYGLTRFFEASVYVAEELDASKVVSEMLDDFAELFTKLQTGIMALQGKPFDFLKEQSILDALTSVKAEIDAWFEKIKNDFLDFGESKTFLENPSNKAVWEGKDILTLTSICFDFTSSDCKVLKEAATHAGKVSLGWQALKILNEFAASNTRLLQLSEPSADQHSQKRVIAAAPSADKAINFEATKIQAEMDEVDAEIKAKAPDAAFGSSSSR